LGAVLKSSKVIIPVIWDMPPDKLRGWMGERQALDIRGATPEVIQAQIGAIAQRIKQSKAKGLLIGGALIAGFFYLASRP
jgi:hypothetical protein